MTHEHRDLQKVIDAFEALKGEWYTVAGEEGSEDSKEIHLMDYLPSILIQYFTEQQDLLTFNKHTDFNRLLKDFEEFRDEAIGFTEDDTEPFGIYMPISLVKYFREMKKTLKSQRR